MTREYLLTLGLEESTLEQILSEAQKERAEDLRRAEEAESRHRLVCDQMIGALLREARPSSRLAEESARRRLQEALALGEDPKEALTLLMTDDPEAFLPKEACGPIFSVVSEAEEPSSFAKLNTRRW